MAIISLNRIQSLTCGEREEEEKGAGEREEGGEIVKSLKKKQS